MQTSFWCQKFARCFPSKGQFVKCEIDAVCLKWSMLSVVEAFAWLVLNGNLHTKGSVEVVAAAQTYISVIAGLQTSESRVRWDAPAILPEAKSFPVHVEHFLSNQFKDPTLFEMVRYMTVI